jgi:diguanylate cyclase (GGDEF)-like protein/PAS domain S-box-containing protein
LKVARPTAAHPPTSSPDPASTDDRQTLISAPVGIFRTDPQGECLFVNERWCQFAGLAAKDALGTGWTAAIHPDDRERVLSEWQTAITEHREFHLEYRYQRPDGSVVWLSGSAMPYPDAHGRPGGHVGTVMDITEAVTARDFLRDESRFVDAVIDVAGSLFCVFDPEGRFLRFNRACEVLSGYTFEEIQGRPFYEFLIPEGEIENVRASLASLRAGDPPSPNENRWVTRDGALRLISWSNVAIYDEDGALTHIVSTGIDVTDERRAQIALHGIEEIGTLLAKQGPTPPSMGAVLRILAEGMGYRYLVLFLREGSLLKVGAQAGYTDLPAAFEPSRGIIGRAFRTGIPAFVPDVAADPDYVEGDPLVMSEIAVPLTAEGVTLGVLSIESIADTPLTLADFQLAEAVAERLSVALLLGREQQALAERARLFAALTNFARTASSMIDSERLWSALLDALAEVILVDASGLVELDRPTGRYLIRAVSGRVDPQAVGVEIRVGEGPTGEAILTRSLVLGKYDRNAFGRPVDDASATDAMATAVVPLIRDGAVLGAIVLGRITEGQPAFSLLEQEILPLVAAQSILALENAHLLQEVSELAIHDPLTGLYNRRHFDAAADQTLARYKRDRARGRPVAAIMFDLDHFGVFNKQYGHAAGDVVLRAFAGILLTRFRASDVVARFGGEEFVAILEGSTLADTVRVAEEVRLSLEHRTIVGPAGEELHATVSAGCAVVDDAEPTREALIRAADVGLFMAKRAGRNQVVAA